MLTQSAMIDALGPRASIRSELYHHFNCFAVIHRSVAIGHRVEINDPIEYASWLNPSLEHIGHQLLDVGTRRSRPARYRHVLEKCGRRFGKIIVLRHADAADRAAWAGDTQRRDVRVAQPDALEY